MCLYWIGLQSSGSSIDAQRAIMPWVRSDVPYSENVKTDWPCRWPFCGLCYEGNEHNPLITKNSQVFRDNYFCVLCFVDSVFCLKARILFGFPNKPAQCGSRIAQIRMLIIKPVGRFVRKPKQDSATLCQTQA
jgi:hypothetical protein